MVAKICKWGLLIWTILIGFGSCKGFYDASTSIQGQVTNAHTIGIILGMGIWFVIWIVGAVALLIIYLFVKK